jgi:methylated-DNA-[protein]-cysteine S-methyltransferase
MPSLVIDTPVGCLTLSAEAQSIVAVSWGSPSRSCETPLLVRAAAQLEAYFAGRRRDFDLPLKPLGSIFRQRVWMEMKAIPFGTTLSYGALAKRLGTAARAVGGACGANPIPILIPCHRVLASNGRIGGYSGGSGVETKQFLLALEGVSLAREPPAHAPLVTSPAGAR